MQCNIWLCGNLCLGQVRNRKLPNLLRTKDVVSVLVIYDHEDIVFPIPTRVFGQSEKTSNIVLVITVLICHVLQITSFTAMETDVFRITVLIRFVLDIFGYKEPPPPILDLICPHCCDCNTFYASSPAASFTKLCRKGYKRITRTKFLCTETFRFFIKPCAHNWSHNFRNLLPPH